MLQSPFEADYSVFLELLLSKLLHLRQQIVSFQCIREIDLKPDTRLAVLNETQGAIKVLHAPPVLFSKKFQSISIEPKSISKC
jgi:hypothetical protein